MQAVDDHHPLLRLKPVVLQLPPWPTLPQRIPEPLCEGPLVIKDLQCSRHTSSIPVQLAQKSLAAASLHFQAAPRALDFCCMAKFRDPREEARLGAAVLSV